MATVGVKGLIMYGHYCYQTVLPEFPITIVVQDQDFEFQDQDSPVHKPKPQLQNWLEKSLLM